MVVDRIGGGAGAIGEAILHIAVNAVWISAVLHGITAAPAARLFSKRPQAGG